MIKIILGIYVFKAYCKTYKCKTDTKEVYC